MSGCGESRVDNSGFSSQSTHPRCPKVEGGEAARARLVELLAELAATGRGTIDLRPSPAVVLVSSRSGGDYGSRLTSSPARGFIPKADLSGEGLQRVLDGLAS